MAFTEKTESRREIETLKIEVSMLKKELESLRKCFRAFSVGVAHFNTTAKNSFLEMEKNLLTNEKK